MTSHPKRKFQYLTIDDLNEITENLLEGLVAQMYLEDVSWQHPGSTSLVIISREEVLLNVLDTECLRTPEHVFFSEMKESK